MTTVKVSLPKSLDDSYKIIIEKGGRLKIPTYLKEQKVGKKYAIITDNKVKRLYGIKLKTALKKADIESEVFSFPEGEKSKNMQTVTSICEQMVAKGFDRKDAVIALGGGVPGDLAGFVAAIYMRGIPFIQIPTTLLAMVDSSVGGKTGVDLDGGKNLIGAFYQPKVVFIDIEHLETLAEKQIRNGLAEIIKYGVIQDEKLFKFIEDNVENIFTLDEQALNHIIKRSVEIKAKVVEEDEKEFGLRMILNYGHTYGHAIEKISEFKLLHGFAISIGMIIANKISLSKGLIDQESSDRIKALIKTCKLPTTTMHKPTAQDLASDKKKSGDLIKLILPTKIGKVKVIEESLKNLK